MHSFYDRTGHTKLWLHPKGSWFLDVRASFLAVLHSDSIYDLRGQHAGWWDGVASAIRDHHGRLVVVADIGPENLGGLRPPWHPPTTPPNIGTSTPLLPTLGLRPSARPLPRKEWTDANLFFDNLAIVRVA